MKILVLGSQRFFDRVQCQTIGQNWELFRAKDSDETKDYVGTHSFQAAIVDLCARDAKLKKAAKVAKSALRIPVVIGLASRHFASNFSTHFVMGTDVVLTDCGEDRLLKLQCDSLLILANGISSKDLVIGDVTFHTSRDAFSVKGKDVHLPVKKHQLLELLFLNHGKIVTKEMIFNHLYGWDEPPGSKIVDVFICHIRKVLCDEGITKDFIQTVRGRGYTLRSYNCPDLLSAA